MRELLETNQFKRDLKKIAKSGLYKKEDFLTVVKMLKIDKILPEKHKDHPLSGNYKEFRECHIKPDWLLIYKKYDNVLLLARMGSHSELF